jgi:hypothetical protein
MSSCRSGPSLVISSIPGGPVDQVSTCPWAPVSKDLVSLDFSVPRKPSSQHRVTVAHHCVPPSLLSPMSD